jgi:predicted nuclease with TOPRIM domain
MRKLHVGWVIFVAVMFLGASGSQTFSQTLQDTTIEQRFTNQTNAINEGVKSKQLNQGEAKILQDNLSRIRQEGVRFQGDGKLTAEETIQLNKMLDQNRQMIQDKKQFPVRPIGSPPKTPAPVPPSPAAASPPPAAVPPAPATTPAAPPPAKPVAPAPPAQAPAPQTLQDTTIEQRFANQTNAINEAVKSRQLNQGEANILQSNLRRIRLEGVRFQRDGKLTAEETAQLNKLLDENRQMIETKKVGPLKKLPGGSSAPID